jgi:SAM-dependent methyltransferase
MMRKEYQGFSQDSMFSLKLDGEIYDDFYANVYDNIHEPLKYMDEEYSAIMQRIQPRKESVILDIGAKTGHFMKLLQNDGYVVHGLEESQAMIDKAQSLYTDLSIYRSNALNSQTFDKNVFNCIFVRDFMIYSFYDKPQMLGNCYYWLKPSGYLVVHLVNKNKYNPLVEIANYDTNPQEYTDDRITKCFVKNDDITYCQETQFKPDNRVVVKETFTDTLTYKTRQNEQTLYMQDIKTLEQIIMRAGFSAKAMYSLKKDKEQFIYIFQKINF